MKFPLLTVLMRRVFFVLLVILLLFLVPVIHFNEQECALLNYKYELQLLYIYINMQVTGMLVRSATFWFIDRSHPTYRA